MDSIQFLTRRGATCSDLLSCLYGLKPMELQVFYDLEARGSATVDDVSDAVHRDRTTTHRCLSKLVSAGLVYRQSKGLKDGGYYHVYAPVETSKIKEQAEMRVGEIVECLRRLLDGFESDLRRGRAPGIAAAPTDGA